MMTADPTDPTDRLRAIDQSPTIVRNRPMGWAENVTPTHDVYCLNHRCGALLGYSTATSESEPEEWKCSSCGTIRYFIVRASE